MSAEGSAASPTAAGGPAAAGPPAGWLSRNLVVLSAVSFFQDAASELLYPILPIFLTAVLGAPVAVVGAIEGLAEGVASVTRVVSGRLADRRARRPLIGAGYGLAALAKVVIALATGWPLVLAARCVDRVGKGIRGAPRDALLLVGVPGGARGRAFGLHRAADTAGAVVGPLIGLAGYEVLHHRIRPLLVLAVVPAVVSVLLIAAVVEPRPAARQAAPSRRAGPAAGLPRPYWRLVTALAIFGLVNFPDALLLLRLRSIGFSVGAVIAAYVTYNAGYALLSYPAGVLADRLGPRRVYAAGLACFAVGYLGLGLTRDHTVAWLLLAAYGGFTACTDGVGKSWVSGLVPADRQGSAQGLYQGLTGGAVLIAGTWAGLAWSGDGRLPLLVSGSVAGVLAAALLAAGGRALRPDRRVAA